jgi:hypothetical protein
MLFLLVIINNHFPGVQPPINSAPIDRFNPEIFSIYRDPLFPGFLYYITIVEYMQTLLRAIPSILEIPGFRMQGGSGGCEVLLK